MKYKNYPARILVHLFNSLKNEAEDEGRSVNRQLETILKDRYRAHAPPPASTQKHPSQFHSKTNKTNGRRVKAKTKAETA